MNTITKFFVMLSMIAIMPVYSSEQTKSTPQKYLTLPQSIFVGSVSGAAEVLATGQVLSYMTNQLGATPPRPISRNPIDWYTGTKANTIGMVLPTAIQKTANVAMTTYAQRAKGSELSDAQKIGIAAGAGALSALALTPPEALATYMQDQDAKAKQEHERAKRPGNPPKMTTSQAIKELGARGVMRGIVPTMLRDAKFTVGYIQLVKMLTPAMQDYTRKHLDNSKTADTVGSIAGGISAGVLTAVASQPAHVIKRALQGDPSGKTYNHPFVPSLQVAQNIYKTEGIKGFFKGGIPRGVRVMCAIPILTAADAMLTHAIQKK